MKFEVQLRVSPAALAVAIKRALISADESTIDHLDTAIEARAEQANALCGRWFQFGDTLTVEIDTDTETCVVVENRAGDEPKRN
jgi:hypothetical protein